MLGIAGLGPALMANAGDRFPQGGASMYSLISATGNIGCAVAPLLIGVMAERWGLRVSMGIMAAGPVIAMAILLQLLPRVRSHVSRAR